MIIETREQWDKLKNMLAEVTGVLQLYPHEARELFGTTEALREAARVAKQADEILMPYWMGPEFGEKPTDKQMYEAIADLNQALAKIKADASWLLEED